MYELASCNEVLVSVLGSISLTITIIIALQYYLYPRTPGMKTWLYAFCFQVLGAGSHIISNIWPSTLTDVIPSCILLSANILLWFGTRQFAGRPIYPRAALGGITLYVIINLISHNFSSLNINFNPEAFSVLCIAMGSLLSSLELITKNDLNLKSTKFVAMILMLHGSVVLFFVIISFVFQDTITISNDTHDARTAMQIGIPLNILFAFSFIFLSHEHTLRLKTSNNKKTNQEPETRSSYHYSLNNLFRYPSSKLPPHSTAFIIQVKNNSLTGKSAEKDVIKKCSQMAMTMMRRTDIVSIHNSTQLIGVLFETKPNYVEDFFSRLKASLSRENHINSSYHLYMGFAMTDKNSVSLENLAKQAEKNLKSIRNYV